MATFATPASDEMYKKYIKISVNLCGSCAVTYWMHFNFGVIIIICIQLKFCLRVLYGDVVYIVVPVNFKIVHNVPALQNHVHV